jgi:hypothetical protein
MIKLTYVDLILRFQCLGVVQYIFSNTLVLVFRVHVVRQVIEARGKY